MNFWIVYNKKDCRYKKIILFKTNVYLKLYIYILKINAIILPININIYIYIILYFILQIIYNVFQYYIKIYKNYYLQLLTILFRKNRKNNKIKEIFTELKK